MAAQVEAGIDLRIGTSGFDYPEWKGVLYPEALPRSEFPAAYGRAFSTLELNFSYYGMPKAANLAALMDRMAAPGLDFSIKAHRSLTHEIEATRLEEQAREFRAGIAPLARAGRLAAILFEFPWRFAYGVEERRYLDRLLGEFGDYTRVVEFRHRDWVNARVLEGLRERGVGFCSLDLPRLEGLPPVADIVTADTAYLRFHGRNAADWWNGDSRGRYDWLYSREDLASWLPRIQAMAARAKKLRIYFNNHARGQAVANARELGALLAGAGLGSGKASLWQAEPSSTSTSSD